MADRPAVSVVIPTRDRWTLLRRTLRSALAQRGVDVQVVVVDDGSANGPPDELAGGDPRVTLVVHESSCGVAKARNAGIAAAGGDWIAFLDDDDLWAPHKLERQTAAAHAVGAAWAYSGVVLVDGALNALEELPAPPPGEVLERLVGAPTSAIPAGASNVCVRTEAVRALGGFDERLFHLADWDLWLRLAERGAPPAACLEPHVAYVRHPGSMLLRLPEPLLDEARYLFGKHAALARDRGMGFDALRFERWVASGHRRAGRRGKAAGVYLRGAARHRSGGNLLRAAGALVGERAWRRAAPRRYEQGMPAPDWLNGVRGVEPPQ